MLRKMACVLFLLLFSGHSFAKCFDCNSPVVFLNAINASLEYEVTVKLSEKLPGHTNS